MDKRGQWSKGMDRAELSEHMRALVMLKHAKTTSEEKSKHAKIMVTARESGRAKRRGNVLSNSVLGAK